MAGSLAGCGADPEEERNLGGAGAGLASDVAGLSGLFTVEASAVPRCPSDIAAGTNALIQGQAAYAASNETDIGFTLEILAGIYDSLGNKFELRKHNLYIAPESAENDTMTPYFQAEYTSLEQVTVRARTYITDETGGVVYSDVSHECTFHVL